ncbi:hypothetical protein GmHk_19G054530 [Glycine max]|nr:hypothetical protein GmHk_19G054530 [Glycine max]
MVDAISSMSLGYKAPNFYRICGPLLNMCVDKVRKLVESYKEVWKETGCTLMADGWTNRSRRTLGLFSLRSNDASYASKIAEKLFKLFKEMRAMVTSRDWTDSTFVKDSKAKKFVEKILDSIFWKQCADIVKLTKPLVRVLHIVDSEDKPAMGFLYQAMHKAREEMVRRFQRNKRKVEPYLEVLDRRWDSQLRKDLHAIGYLLNPACRFNAKEFEKHRNTQSSILELIDRYTFGDLELQDKLNQDIRIHKNSERDFARRAAIRERNTIMPCEFSINGGIVINVVLRVLEESPPFLTHKEGEALCDDLANMFIQSTSDDIDKLDLDEDEDDDVPQPPNNTMEDVNPNESNIGEESHSFDGEELPKVDPTLYG